MSFEELIVECLANLEDDAPRLVWADAIGGERGELVVLQCALARGGQSPRESGMLRRRQRELLAARGVEWSGLARIAKRCRFRRGFVEYLAIDAPRLLPNIDAVFAIAPFVRVLHVDETTEGQLEEIAALPEVAQLRGFGFGATGQQPGQLLARLAERGTFARLESLSTSFFPEATASMLDSVANLRRVDTGVGELPAPELIAQMSKLRSLQISYKDSTSLARVLPDSVVELEIRAACLPAFANAPIAARLEGLAVSETEGPIDLSAFRALRSLHVRPVRGTIVDTSFVDHVPALRELRCSRITPAVAHAIVDTLGEQLEQLEISVTGEEQAALADVPWERVAGDAHVTLYVLSGIPLFAGELPGSSMWDYPWVQFPRAQ